MYADQCISVTDLRRKTSSFIGNAKDEQFIFVGSKPTNVLISMSRYEEFRRMEDALYEKELDLHFVAYAELDEEGKNRYDRAKQEPLSSYVNL